MNQTVILRFDFTRADEDAFLGAVALLNQSGAIFYEGVKISSIAGWVYVEGVAGEAPFEITAVAAYAMCGLAPVVQSGHWEIPEWMSPPESPVVE